MSANLDLLKALSVDQGKRFVRRQLRANLRAAEERGDPRQIEACRTELELFAPPYIIHCPRYGCLYAASAQTEGRIVAAIAQHLVEAHNEVERS